MLVVAQFAVSIGLIICTAVVYAQTEYARNVDPGYRSRRADPDRGHQPAPADPASGDAAARDRAAAGRDLGRAHHIGIATPTSTNTRRACSRASAEPVNIGNYQVDYGFLPDDGHPAARRAACSTRTGRRTTPPCLSRTIPTAIRRADRARRSQRRDQRARRAAAWASPNPAERSARRLRASLAGRGIWPGADRRSSASSRIRASARSASRSIRSCSVSTATRTTHMLVRYDRCRSRSGVRAAVEQAWKRIATDAPFDGAFSEDIIVDLYKAETRAGEGLRRLRAARGDRRLPRPVRARRLHRRAADQGDRHPQGARRAQSATSSGCSPGNSRSR